MTTSYFTFYREQNVTANITPSVFAPPPLNKTEQIVFSLIKNNPYADNFIKDDIYCFSFDRKGKLFFESPYNDYNNQKSRFVQVLTEQVDPRYISYLDSKGIAYIFAGKDDLDIDLFLAKLEKYGIDKFFLCGGGEERANLRKRR